MKISALKPQQIVWSIRRHKMGNTTVSTISVYQVKILQVSETAVYASWNGNPPQSYYARDVAEWKAKKPITVKTWNGYGQRLATREEIKAMKEKELAGRLTPVGEQK